MALASAHAHATGLGAGPARRLITNVRSKLVWPLVLAMGWWPHLAHADDISGWGPQQRARSLGPSISVQGAAAAPPKPLNVEDAAAETIKLTNAFRLQNGLPAFALDPVCRAASHR